MLNDQPDAEDIRAFFATGGGSDATIYLQTTTTDSETLIVTDTIDSSGAGNVVRFNPSTDFETLLSNIGLDDRFIIASYRPIPETDGTGTITSGTPTIEATGTETDTLALSDFVLPDDQELIFSALILAGGSGENIYRDQAGQTTQGTLLDGDLSLEENYLISRIRYRASNEWLILNDQPDDDNLGAYYNTGIGSTSIIYLHVSDGTTATLSVTNTLDTFGIDFARFSATPEFMTLLAGIGNNDRFIIASYRAIPASTATATIIVGTPVITATGSSVAPISASTATITSNNPRVIGNGTFIRPIANGTADIDSNNPSVQAIGTSVAPMSVAMGTITAGTPSVGATGTQTIPLALSDFTLPDGQELIFSALILAGGSGIDIYRDPRNDTAIGTLLDGDLSLTATHFITRIRYRTNQLVFNDQPDADDIRAFF